MQIKTSPVKLQQTRQWFMIPPHPQLIYLCFLIELRELHLAPGGKQKQVNFSFALMALCWMHILINLARIRGSAGPLVQMHNVNLGDKTNFRNADGFF